MRVVLKTGRAGQGFVQRKGQTIEVTDREGRALIDNGDACIETAMDEQKREKAVVRSAYRGR